MVLQKFISILEEKRYSISTTIWIIPFGNVGDIFLGKKCIGETVAEIYNKLKTKSYDYGGYYVFTKPIFIPIDPNLIRNILIKDFSHFVERGTHYDEKVDPLSCHLFSIRNPKWHELRTKFSPMFTSARLREMFPIFSQCSDELNKCLAASAYNGESINAKDIFGRFTTDMIAKIAFGLECNSLANSHSKLHEFGQSFIRASLRNSIVFCLGLIAPRVLEIFKVPICDPKNAEFFLALIKNTVEHREKHNIDRKDMMNLLIKLKNNKSIDGNDTKTPTRITFNELAAQAFIFFLGGFESTSSIVSFTVFELAKNEDIQNKLREEILEVLEKYNGEITYEGLNEMMYLEKVFQETLRLYAVIPILNRECIKDYTIPGTDIVIEKGTSVVISTLGMHKDPEYFENPDLFDPDRFNNGKKQLLISNTYLPFGAGPRNCVGLRLGQIQSKIGLVTLLRNYKFSLDPEKKIPTNLDAKAFILAFEDIIWLKISKI